MTGYGRAEAKLPGGKVTVEIRSLNAKGADISIKSQILPKDKEIVIYCAIGLRAYIAYRILSQHGFTNIRSISGGYRTYQMAVRKF